MDTQPTQQPQAPQAPQPTPQPVVPTQPQAPAQPQPQPSATVQSQNGPQASAYAGANVPGTMALPTDAVRAKNKRLGWILTGIMIAIIVVGLFFGYVLPIASIIGAYAVSIAIRYKLTAIAWTAGVIGGLNLALYILTFIVN